MDNITDALEWVMTGNRKPEKCPPPRSGSRHGDFDPKDPANKYEVGGLIKLAPRGIEICYRLFDAGKRQYAVATLMGISFGAATHQLDA